MNEIKNQPVNAGKTIPNRSMFTGKHGKPIWDPIHGDRNEGLVS
jgi:hypothetical protein